MNCIRWGIGAFVISGWSAYGQWAVYDGAVHGQIISGTAQEVAKMVEQINNQVKQIKHLEDQATTLHHYVDLFGNPATAKAAVTQVASDLTRAETGKTFDALVAGASGAKALTHDSQSRFLAPKPTVKTLEGTIPREEAAYRFFAPIQDAAVNYTKVAGDVSGRRVVIKAEIRSNLEALQSAKTDAEVQKIAATLAASTSALEALSQELDQAASAAVVQDVENRNDQARQAQAHAEQRQAELQAALQRQKKKFRLITAPVLFP